MTKKLIAILILVVALAGIVTWEQVYTDNSISSMLEEISTLSTEIENKDLESSKVQAQKIIDKWEKEEAVICLFVDFRDIEQIGKQADLVLSHLENEDFELAKVECNILRRVVETFENMVGIDWQNIF